MTFRPNLCSGGAAVNGCSPPSRRNGGSFQAQGSAANASLRLRISPLTVVPVGAAGSAAGLEVAKRLDCVRFTGAFRSGRWGPGESGAEAPQSKRWRGRRGPSEDLPIRRARDGRGRQTCVSTQTRRGTSPERKTKRRKKPAKTKGSWPREGTRRTKGNRALAPSALLCGCPGARWPLLYPAVSVP